MDWVSDPDFPQEMGDIVKDLDVAISDIEQVVNALTSIPLSESQESMEPLDKARYDTAAVYAVSSLFWAYMKVKGVDPKAHGLPKELERVKTAVGRAKQIADKALAPKVDVGAAKRFIRSGLYDPKEGTAEKSGSSSASTSTSDCVVLPPASKKIRFDDST